MDTWLVHRAVCQFTPQLSLVLTAPILWGMGWPGWVTWVAGFRRSPIQVGYKPGSASINFDDREQHIVALTDHFFHKTKSLLGCAILFKTLVLNFNWILVVVVVRRCRCRSLGRNCCFTRAALADKLTPQISSIRPQPSKFPISSPH